jgi:hypothetical protein
MGDGILDRTRYEYLNAAILHERLAEARRAALADLVPSQPGVTDRLALALGDLFIRIGCRLDATGRRRSYAVPRTLWSAACGHVR